MNKSKTKILKQQKVFPWWLGYLLDNPLRRLLHPAEKLLAPYVKNGMTTLDYGCGFGHYSIGMAKLTGRNGKVIAVDIQKKMLSRMMTRAGKAGVDKIIKAHLCDGKSIGISDRLDFAVISNSLHETPNPSDILREIFTLLKPDGILLLLEPKAVKKYFNSEVETAKNIGYIQMKEPVIFKQLTAIFRKKGVDGTSDMD
ncbi:Methyltransferase type 11 [Denitrovibrio acetiphilus DSM 12809]|uniref:Methyltransferase type 11 n=1 Tax=Denitrovibrio acetiphilus (strain DSM 12809 / NBRC 114555 / N2460) TaxID=522772 RepID=D4H8W0_DENA2|nr:class I SAM-dependent methyltransferase [Denitrovibrio acetiphilus]ADD68459.1 Methyltransferase type 11 [Denitrovibrio acetiphilus DSM 12809]